MAALRTWTHKIQGRHVHFHMDNTMAATIFQLGRGKDTFIQACARKLWLICAHSDITLAVSHIHGVSLTLSADTLGSYHMGQSFKDIVQHPVNKGVELINPAPNPFHLSDDL